MKTLIRFSTAKYDFYFTRLPCVILYMYGIKSLTIHKWEMQAKLIWKLKPCDTTRNLNQMSTFQTFCEIIFMAIYVLDFY